MWNLIFVGCFCFLLCFKEGGCVKKGQEELSDSFLKDLFRKIQDQDEKIVALEAKSMLDYEDLTSKITTLEAKLRDSHSKQKRFESTIKKLYGIIADMKKKPKTMKRSMLKSLRFSGKSGLIDAKSDLETVNVIKKTTTGGPESVSEGSNQANFSLGRASTGYTIAFYAYLGHVEVSPGLHHTLIFDTVITNVGSSYNHHDGVFTATVSGVYVFNWNLYSSYDGDVVSELMVNSEKKGGRRSDSKTGAEDHSTSGCVVVEIRQGDVVYVRTHPTHEQHGDVISYPGVYESSFSGWILAW